MNSHKILHKHIDSHVTVKCDKEIKKKERHHFDFSIFSKEICYFHGKIPIISKEINLW